MSLIILDEWIIANKKYTGLQITSENQNLDTDQQKTQHEARLTGIQVQKTQNMFIR